MKKGMIIALLMVAMVALAASASAVAPTIQSLPSVIIGDVGDVVGAGTGAIDLAAATATDALHLLRYENVVDLGAAVKRVNNPSTTTFMKVYYTTSNPAVKAGNSAAVAQAMTDTELTNLLSGTAPAAAKQINNPATDTQMSLISGATGTFASISAATPAANGATTAALTATGVLTTPTVLGVYATDYFMATDKVASGSMVVYSVIGANDGPSPADEEIYRCDNLATATGNDGWAYNDGKSAQTGTNANLQTVPSTTTANGVGFKGLVTYATGKSQGYASWAHTGNGAILAGAANMDSKIYRATIVLGGNATSPKLCPSYRILFMSTGFAHVGGFQVTTTSGTADTHSAINYPSASTPLVTTRLYWACPKSMNQYGDGEKAATVAGTEDKRSYYMTFDAMQMEAGDIGVLTMNSVVIAKTARPAGAAPTMAWGNGARAFNETATAWASTGNDGGTGWGTGNVVVAADAVSLAMVAIRASVFSQVTPTVTETAGYPAWTSNKLVRVAYTLNVSNVDTCPQIRTFVLPWRVPLGTFKIGNTMWGEALDPSVWRAWYPRSLNLGLAASPKTAADGGSVFETYIYTMNAPSEAAESCILTPVLDIDQNNVTGFPTNGWAKPNATVQITGCTMEVITVE